MPTRKLITLCWLQILCIIEIYSLGLEEDDLCLLNHGQQGYCTRLDNCTYAIDLIKSNILPKTCGFRGTQAIVCCKESNSLPVVTQTQTTMANVSNNSISIVDRGQSKVTDKEEEKIKQNSSSLSYRRCLKYLRKVNPVLILVNGDKGGIPVRQAEFSHMAEIGYGSRSEPQWLCGGSIISKKFILTAAHCIHSTQYGHPVLVRLGEIDLSINSNNTQDIPVKFVYYHPKYILPQRHNDIGLLELEHEIDRTYFVGIACLDTSGNNWNNQELTAAGWGRTTFFGEESNFLLKVNMKVVPFDQCKFVYLDLNDTLQICAGDGKITDTCQGDSGGPLQRRDFLTSDNAQKVYFIVGITSYGKACGISGSPGVYTRVYSHLHWIENIVWGTE